MSEHKDKKIQVKIVELIEINGKHVSKEGGKRQYHHKSKNGCDNCKRRRIKCSEEKPRCVKCENLSLECFYSAPQPRRRRTKKEIEMLKKNGLIDDIQPYESSLPAIDSSISQIRKEKSSSDDNLFGNTSSRQNSNGLELSEGSRKRKLSSAFTNTSPMPPNYRDSKSTIIKYVVTKEDGTKVTIEDDEAIVSKSKSPRSKSNTSNGGNELKNDTHSGSSLKQDIPNSHSNGNIQQLFQNSLNGNPLIGIPQLMSLTSSEKYANAISASSDTANALKGMLGNGNNVDNQFSAIFQNLSNALNSPQSNNMSLTNSIGNFFSLNNAKLLSTLTKHQKAEADSIPSTKTSGTIEENTIVNNVQASNSENPQTPEIFKKDIADLSKNISLNNIKQHLGGNKSPKVNLPKLASAFSNGQNSWGPILSSLSGGNQSMDDLTTTAMNFLSSVGNMNNNNNHTKLRKSSISGLPNSQQTDSGKIKFGGMIKNNQASTNAEQSGNDSVLKGTEARKNMVQSANPPSSAPAGTPSALAGLANLGMHINGTNLANMIPTSMNYLNNNGGDPLQNSFGNFHTHHKMSIPSTPNMFQPAGIGGITYDFNDLIGGVTNSNSGNDPKIPHGSNINDKIKDAASLLATPEILKSPLISDSGNKNAFSRVQQDLKDEAVEVLSTMATVAQRDKKTANDNKNSPGNILKQQQLDLQARSDDIPFLLQLQGNQIIPGLNLIDLKLFHHYLSIVSTTIIESGICVSTTIWTEDIPELAFQFPFLMHAILAFSATHLSRYQEGLEETVATHRLDCLKLLKDAVLEITPENTDALVASAIILIMDSLANAVPAQQNQEHSESTNEKNGGMGDFTTSAWIFHVKGAATILTAVWPLPETSRFYNLINVDLSELGQYLMASSAAEVAVNSVLSDSGTANNLGSLAAENVMPGPNMTDFVCFDETIADLYPIEIDSPYLITLAYLDKLHKGVNNDGFILRIFSFPALLDKTFLLLLMTGDMNAMRIMRCYYKMLRSFVTEKKDKIWFLEGLTQVLPADVDEYSGGGVYMMLDFLGNGLPSMMANVFDSSLNNGFDFSALAPSNNDMENVNNKS
ncbi:hypothetical protein QEN19_001974 [Hanseniaspora menglaensis]